MDEVTRGALLYHRWANLQLLDQCARLTAEQLQLSAPGTYGTIAATWMHILAAEQRYVRRIAGTEAVLSEQDDFPGIAPLKEHARRSGDALIAAAERLEASDTTEVDYDGQKVVLMKSLIVVQAIHHGNDHRTQIGTILLSHSLPLEDIDVWSYGLTVQC
jgi:uncharacterized damage-inducible protein DinB